MRQPWNDFVTIWPAIPGHRLLDIFVAPRTFWPWQIASIANAIFSWALYIVADWVVTRWERGERVHKKVVELTTRWLSLIRGLLSVYTIFCCVYLAVSLSGRWGLPPMGTGIVPWL